jgi:chorismate mutase
MNTDGDGWASGTQNLVMCRGVRGAITVEENSREAILEGTRELLMVLIKLNGIHADDVASAIFTTTPDLNAEYPAVAARQLGWHDVALLCAHEMNVPHGLTQCIRILLHWNTTRRPDEIQHAYLKGANHLRPDRSIEMTDLTSILAENLDLEDRVTNP